MRMNNLSYRFLDYKSILIEFLNLTSILYCTKKTEDVNNLQLLAKNILKKISDLLFELNVHQSLIIKIQYVLACYLDEKALSLLDKDCKEKWIEKTLQLNYGSNLNSIGGVVVYDYILQLVNSLSDKNTNVNCEDGLPIWMELVTYKTLLDSGFKGKFLDNEKEIMYIKTEIETLLCRLFCVSPYTDNFLDDSCRSSSLEIKVIRYKAKCCNFIKSLCFYLFIVICFVILGNIGLYCLWFLEKV